MAFDKAAFHRNMNGVRVTTHTPTTVKGAKPGPKTIFIPLPRELWRECGPCGCGKCGPIAYWDTVAVSPDSEYTWTVHYPELQNNI